MISSTVKGLTMDVHGSERANRSGVPSTRPTHGGTLINLVFAVVFFGLLALGVLWILKMVGQAGQQYSTAMIQTTHRASALQCQSNLRTIWQSVHMYAISNESLPPTQQALIDSCGYGTRLFHCDEPNAPQYVYIAGQTLDMAPTNVLLYEPEPVHEGQCSVLFLDGRMAMLDPDELKMEVEATIANVRQRRR